MKKIRINELARELEVKAHEILDLLPELGVTEKKTHSSSIDEDVALKLRKHYGFDAPESTDDDGDVSVAVEERERDDDADSDALPAPVPAVIPPAPPAPRIASETVAPPKEEKPAEELERPAPGPA